MSVLTDIRNFLASSGLKLSRKFQDDRTNATINEGEILDVIAHHFEIKRPESRHWYDFSIEGYPVNIKVSNMDRADNLSCKLGIYYALTGLWPNFQNEIGWGQYFTLLADNLGKKTTGNYYFLVINRQLPNDVLLVGLKELAELQPNGNNLPFQCHWGKNRTPILRTHDQAIRFILHNLRMSLELRARVFHEFCLSGLDASEPVG